MTIKEFANMLDGRSYGNEITKEEEALAKELGFVVVFGASDDLAEIRGAINDEIGCYDGGLLKHKDLPGEIYADWCPEDLGCSWAYGTQIPHEKFFIYEDDELYCEGIVCDINKPKLTNADRRRLIDADTLKEKATLRHGFDFQGVFVKVQDIDKAPTIDPVHAAGGCYCRECEFKSTNNGYLLDDVYCTAYGVKQRPSGFCSYGRRREGTDE